MCLYLQELLFNGNVSLFIRLLQPGSFEEVKLSPPRNTNSVLWQQHSQSYITAVDTTHLNLQHECNVALLACGNLFSLIANESKPAA